MLDRHNITEKQAKKLLKLVKAHAKAEVVARFGKMPKDVYTCAVNEMVKRSDELREYALGTSDMVRLGKKWGIIKKKKRNRNK